MANDVKKPKSIHSLTKLISQESPHSGRDHQDNNNQTSPIIATKDQAIDIPSNFSDIYDTATTTATTVDQKPHKNRNQNDSSELTQEEEMQQWEDDIMQQNTKRIILLEKRKQNFVILRSSNHIPIQIRSPTH